MGRISKAIYVPHEMGTLPQTLGGAATMTAPQPITFTCRQGARVMGPWDRNHGFFHMSKARKPSHVTLIMQNWLPLGENPFGLEPPRQGSHVEQAKKVSCWTHDAQSTASRADCACSAPKQTTDKLCVSPPKRKVGREEQLETPFVSRRFVILLD